MIGGFSQGAVMSYALGLGSGRPTPAGIIALSGFIPTVAGLLARPREPPRPSGRDRARHARPGHRHRVRARRARPPHRRRARRPVPRVADVAHDRHRLHRRAARLAPGPHSRPRPLDASAHSGRSATASASSRFGRGSADEAGAILAERGFTGYALVTTERASAERPLARRARRRRRDRAARTRRRRSPPRCVRRSPASRSSPSAAAA